MALQDDYKVERYSTEIDAAEYIDNFRDEARFIEACRQCPNFGNSWGCPPFNFNLPDYLRQFRRVRLFALKITPTIAGQPLSASRDLIKPERMKMEAALLKLEKELGGRAFSYVGNCLYCEGSCARTEGKPCRHPDKVRPSLEALGFDIGRTLTELFGIELKWGADGKMPEYLVLVSGVMWR